MKKMFVLLAGLLAAAVLNAGNVADAEDMKSPKDIILSVKKLEYLGEGKVAISYDVNVNEEVKNPLECGLHIFGMLPDKEKYYVNIGGMPLSKVAPGSGTQSFEKQFSLTRPYHLKQKKVIDIKEADVPEKITVILVVYARKPHTRQVLKNRGVVGFFKVEKDAGGKIKAINFESKKK